MQDAQTQSQTDFLSTTKCGKGHSYIFKRQMPVHTFGRLAFGEKAAAL